MRRGVYAAVPWFALVLVVIVLFVELSSRRGSGEPVPAAGTPPSVSPAPPRTSDARLLADLSAARAEAEAARAEARDAVAGLAEAREQRNQAEAGRAVAEARVKALEAENAAARERLAVLEKDLAEAKDAATRAADPVESLLADAARAKDPADTARLDRAAAGLAPDRIERLRERLEADPDARRQAVKFAGHLPDGPATRGAVGALLRSADAEEAPATYVEALAPHLRRAEVAAVVLDRAGPAVRREVLARLAAWAEPWKTEERETVSKTLLRLLADADEGAQAVGARGVGALRVPGAAERLSSLLSSASAEVRAASAHALSRVPDLASVRDAVKPRLLALLADASLPVRQAGALLAEATLGAAVAFDPAAPEGERRAALDALRARLVP